MALNDIKFVRENGGMARFAGNEDVISGLIMNLEDIDFITTAENTAFQEVEIIPAETDPVAPAVNMYIAKLNYFEELSETFGLSKQGLTYNEGVLDSSSESQAAINAIVYHVTEFFRQSPGAVLHLALLSVSNDVPGEAITFLQSKAEGKIRQVGIFTPSFSAVKTYQYAAAGDGTNKGLEQLHRPLSIVVTAKKGQLTLNSLTGENTLLSEDASYDSMKNVSLLIACDLDNGLLLDLGDTLYGYYGCVGNLLGCISYAAVNESIAWVGKFRAGLVKPGFITGDLLNEISETKLNLLNDNRYIFVRFVEGVSNNYYNDSFTLDPNTSDYAYIENVRTMDKAVREIRRNLVPYLNSPISINAENGQISLVTVSNLENIANSALENMVKLGEMSGYRVVVNPSQNVLATGEIEFQIKNVPTGIVRNMKIKIGFTQKLS